MPSIFDRIAALEAQDPPSQRENRAKTAAPVSRKGQIRKSSEKAKRPKKDADAFWADRTNSDPLKVRLDAAREARYPLWGPPRRSIRGSKVGDKCPRFITIQAAGFEQPPTAKQSRIWDMGKAIEGVIIQNMKDAEVWVDDDVEITYDEPRVVGHVDVVIELDGKLFFGEIKTINSNGFSRLPPEEGTPDKPIQCHKSALMATHSGYVEQLNTYLCAEDARADVGFFLYECKDTCDQKVYWVRADRTMMEPRLENAMVADGYIQAIPQLVGPIPMDRDPIGGDPVCNKCPAREICLKAPPGAHPIEVMRSIQR